MSDKMKLEKRHFQLVRACLLIVLLQPVLFLSGSFKMKEMNGADVLIKCLEDLGVKYIFCYTGAAILPVFHALRHSDIEIIVNSNEQPAAFSAAGYSRSSNRVGVAIVTSGLAITNTLTSVADAYGDSIPLLVFAGQVPEHKIGTDSYQHINVKFRFFRISRQSVDIILECLNIESHLEVFLRITMV